MTVVVVAVCCCCCCSRVVVVPAAVVLTQAGRSKHPRTKSESHISPTVVVIGAVDLYDFLLPLPLTNFVHAPRRWWQTRRTNPWMDLIRRDWEAFELKHLSILVVGRHLNSSI